MKIRSMCEEDIDFALYLTKTEGWSDIRDDFSALIAYKPNAVFVLEEQEESVGMISAVSYGEIGFIGSLIVRQERRGKGFGEHLLKFGIQHLWSNGVSCIMLDAVPEAMSLYSRNGFQPLCKSLRLAGRVQGNASGDVRRITVQDLSAIFEMDRIAFGGDRSHFLKTKWNQNPQLSLCIECDGEIIAFAMGSNREGHVRIAPWIATRNYDFNTNLLSSMALEIGQERIGLGVLEFNTEAVSLAKKAGLSEYSFSVRMALGNPIPDKEESQQQYAIGSPAKG